LYAVKLVVVTQAAVVFKRLARVSGRVEIIL